MASKPKDQTTPDGAQTTGEALTEQEVRSQRLKRLEAAKDAEAFMASYQGSDQDVLRPGLRWKDEDLQKYFRTRYFRHDEVDNNIRAIKAESFVQVIKGNCIMDIPFEDIFESDQFDDDGTVTKGQVLDKYHNRRIKENYLFLQPIGAYEAMLALKAKSSREYVNPKPKVNDLHARTENYARKAGVTSSDAVRITEANLGGEDTSREWESLER